MNLNLALCNMLTHVEHSLCILWKGDIVDAYGKVKGVGEVDRPIHRIYRAISDVEQGGCVVKAQIPKRDKENEYIFPG